MFDVPPPNEVRGIVTYRETTLLRCATAEELRKDPDSRVRPTVRLRKEGGRWVVSHEHHSFPARD
jgi:ketosteroid isomerase-like protein